MRKQNIIHFITTASCHAPEQITMNNRTQIPFDINDLCNYYIFNKTLQDTQYLTQTVPPDSATA